MPAEEYQHRFTCEIYNGQYYSNLASDEECLAEFVSRYGHTPEETTDDELVSLCDTCNEEYKRKSQMCNNDLRKDKK